MRFRCDFEIATDETKIITDDFSVETERVQKHHQSRRGYAIATVQRKTAETVTRSLLIMDRSWFDCLVLTSRNRQITRLWLRRDDQTLKL
jgi:hypothetical protein